MALSCATLLVQSLCLERAEAMHLLAAFFSYKFTSILFQPDSMIYQLVPYAPSNEVRVVRNNKIILFRLIVMEIKADLDSCMILQNDVNTIKTPTPMTVFVM